MRILYRLSSMLFGFLPVALGAIACGESAGTPNVDAAAVDAVTPDAAPPLVEQLAVSGGGFNCVVQLPPVAKLALGFAHACAITRDHRLFCWGANESGQLGLGDRQERGGTVPLAGLVAVDLGVAPLDVVAGRAHTCVRLDGGAVLCWGKNTDANSVRYHPFRHLGGAQTT